MIGKIYTQTEFDQAVVRERARGFNDGYIEGYTDGLETGSEAMYDDILG